jgi:hypothetical protein
MLKKNADKTIASGIFFPFVFILNGKNNCSIEIMYYP